MFIGSTQRFFVLCAGLGGLLAGGCTSDQVVTGEDPWASTVEPETADPAVTRPLGQSSTLPMPTGAAPGFTSVRGPVTPACRWDLTEPSGVSLEDMDGDGVVDLVEARCDALYIHYGAGDGVAYETVIVRELGWAPLVYTHDLDGDGLSDVIWPSRDGIRLLRNVGGREFVDIDMGLDFCATCEAPPGARDGLSVYHINIFDADRDGDDDLMLGGFSFGPVVLLHPDGERGGPDHALPVELWLRDGDRFVRDESFPVTRGFTMHSLVEYTDEGVRIYVLNDFANLRHDYFEYDQIGTSTVVEGSPGAWSELLFRDIGLAVESPMGGWLRDFDGDGLQDMVASRSGGFYAVRGSEDVLYDVTSLWGLPVDGAGVTWSILPIDPWHDGRAAMFVTNGDYGGADHVAPEPVDQQFAGYCWGAAGFTRESGLLPGGAVNARGAVKADLNGDGRQDLVVRVMANERENAHLEMLLDQGGGGHVVELQFEGCSPLGARITSTLHDERFMPYQNAGSFGNAPTDRLTLPLGDLTEDHVVIEFLDGSVREREVGADTRVIVNCGE